MLRCVWSSLVPVKAAMMLADFIGINKFMEEFHGHTKREWAAV